MSASGLARGWIGVDLDGTLAHYDEWRGDNHIGDPIPEMVERVKAWLAKGQEVRIFTARVSGIGGDRAMKFRELIQDWLEAVGLPRLEVTCVKDYQMVELWDDRAVGVVPNTGKSERETFLFMSMADRASIRPSHYFETITAADGSYHHNPLKLSGKR